MLVSLSLPSLFTWKRGWNKRNLKTGQIFEIKKDAVKILKHMMAEISMIAYKNCSSSFVFEVFFSVKKKSPMLACRLVCCAHQSDRRIWVCISHQLYRNIWISYTNHRRKWKCWTNQTLNQDFFYWPPAWSLQTSLTVLIQGHIWREGCAY